MLNRIRFSLPASGNMLDVAKRSLPWIILILVATISATAWRRVMGGDTLGYADCGARAAHGFLLDTDNFYFAYPVMLRMQWWLGMGKTLFSLHLIPSVAAALAPVLLAMAVYAQTGRRLLACMTGVALIVFPLQMFVVNVPLTESLFICGLTFCLWLMAISRRKPWALWVLLPLQAWLIMVRYDAIMLLPFILAHLWLSAKGRGVSRWRRLAIIIGSGSLALLVMAPQFASNARRSQQSGSKRIDPQVHQQLAQELPAQWEQHSRAVKPGERDVDIRPIRQWYETTFPGIPLSLRDAILRVNKDKAPTGSCKVGTSLKDILPLGKVNGWGRVVWLQLLHGPAAWWAYLVRTWQQTNRVLSLGMVASLAVMVLVYVWLLALGIRESLHRRDAVLIVVASYTVIYGVIAVLLIQGNVTRHMARVVPALLFVMAVGVPRWTYRTRPRRYVSACVGAGLLFLASAVVTAGYIQNRTDQIWTSLWRIKHSSIQWEHLYKARSLVCRNLFLQECLLNKSRRQQTKWLVPPDETVWIDLMKDALPEGVTLEGWTLSRPPLDGRGEFGLYQGSWPVTCTLRIPVSRPVRFLMISTILNAGAVNRSTGDTLAIDVSADEGKSWQAVSLPSGAWHDLFWVGKVDLPCSVPLTSGYLLCRFAIKPYSLFAIKDNLCLYRFYGEEVRFSYSRVLMRSYIHFGLVYADEEDGSSK